MDFNSIAYNHLISAKNLTLVEIRYFIEEASNIKTLNYSGNISKELEGKIMCNLFYEPSTRTSCSFHVAMLKLGGQVITVNEEYSSSQKGESLTDTIKTMNEYADIIVLRHPKNGSALEAASVSEIPTINAGDGSNEHPTQSLLDIFTIKTELEKNNINLYTTSRDKIYITFVGDLKNSRTVHSLIRMLCLFPKLVFIYVCPYCLQLPEEIRDFVSSFNIVQLIIPTIEEAIRTSDVVYMTRIQKERFSEDELAVYDTIQQNNNYKINTTIMSKAKSTMILMHPLPRLDEIAEEVDSDPRAVYFEQVKNGVFMRMAILLDYCNK